MPFTEAFKHQTEEDIRRVLRENITLTDLQDVQDLIRGLGHMLNYDDCPHLPANPRIIPGIFLLNKIFDPEYVKSKIKPYLLPAYTPSLTQSISNRWHQRTQEEKEDVAVNKYIELVTEIIQNKITRLVRMSHAEKLALITRFNQPTHREAKRAREEKLSGNPAIGFYSSSRRALSLDFTHTIAADQTVVTLHGMPLKSFTEHGIFFHAPQDAEVVLQAPLPLDEVTAGVQLLLNTVALGLKTSTLALAMAKYLLDQGVVPTESGELEYKARGLRM